MPKVKLEVVVHDNHAIKMELIVSSAKTGKNGDGRVLFSLSSPPCASAPESRARQQFRHSWGGAVERARKSDGVLPTGILRFSSVSSRYCLSL